MGDTRNSSENGVGGQQVPHLRVDQAPLAGKRPNGEGDHGRSGVNTTSRRRKSERISMIGRFVGLRVPRG